MQVISLEINVTEFHILQSNSQLIPAASSQSQQDFFCLLTRVCTDSFVKRLLLTLNVSHVFKISNDFKCRVCIPTVQMCFMCCSDCYLFFWIVSHDKFNQSNRTNAGIVHFCKPETCWSFLISLRLSNLASFFSNRSCFGFKYLVLLPLKWLL